MAHWRSRIATVVAACVALSARSEALALPNSGPIPILTYHSWASGHNAALESDLQTLDQQGYKIIPAFWAVQWMLGERDGSTLPEKCVALTFDDGDDNDWYDTPTTKSVRRILQEFKAGHVAQPNTHGSMFVIASPTARAWISPDGSMRDDWWAAANTSGVMEIYNHTADHDHPSIADNQPPFGVRDVPVNDPSLFDPYLNIWIAVSAGPGGGIGDGDMSGIDRYQRCYRSITKAADYIHQKIYPAWPDLFAYPYDDPAASPFMWEQYFPNFMSEHLTKAAFVTGRGDLSENYLTRADNRWLVNRFLYSQFLPDGWGNTSELISILNHCEANGQSLNCPTLSFYSPTPNAQGRAVVNSTSVSVLSTAVDGVGSGITSSTRAEWTRFQANGSRASGSMNWYFVWVTPSICLGPGDNIVELTVRDQWDNVASNRIVIQAPLSNPVCPS